MTLEEEIEALQKQLQEKKQLQAEYNRAWDEAISEDIQRFPPPIIITVLEFHDNPDYAYIKIQLDRHDKDVANILYYISGSGYSSYHLTATIPFKSWAGFTASLSELKNTKLVLDDITRKRIIEFKLPSDIELYVVKNNDVYTRIGIKTRHTGDSYYFTNNLRTAILKHEVRTVYVELMEYEFVPQIIEQYKLDKKRLITYDESWNEYGEYLKRPKEKNANLTIQDNETVKQLRPFQQEGIKFVYEHEVNALIGDEMGLGKSVQALLSFDIYANNVEASDPNKKLTCLILCPASLRTNWMREVFKWTGHSAYLLGGSRPDPVDMKALVSKQKRYYIINYDPIAVSTDDTFIWVELINLADIDCIIADEIHYIKNTGSKRSQATLQLKAKHKIGLSGTLVVNRPRELWAPIKFIDTKLAGSYEGFVRFYETYNKEPKNLNHLKSTLSSIMVRRTKKDVLPELPPINRIIREYDLTDVGNREYNLALQGLFKALDKWQDESDAKAIVSILEQLLRLKQICAKDKVDFIADLMRELYENNTTEYKKVIAFSQFTSAPPVLSEVQYRLGLEEALVISGEVPNDERDKIVQRFQTDDKIKYLLCSYGTGAEGLNITAAGSVVHCDFTWTPKSHTQAEGRAYGRLSDLHTIDSYYLETSGTIEVEIMNLLRKKLMVSNKVLDNADINERDIGSIQMDLLKVLKEQRLATVRK